MEKIRRNVTRRNITVTPEAEEILKKSPNASKLISELLVNERLKRAKKRKITYECTRKSCNRLFETTVQIDAYGLNGVCDKCLWEDTTKFVDKAQQMPYLSKNRVKKIIQNRNR